MVRFLASILMPVRIRPLAWVVVRTDCPDTASKGLGIPRLTVTSALPEANFTPASPSTGKSKSLIFAFSSPWKVVVPSTSQVPASLARMTGPAFCTTPAPAEMVCVLVSIVTLVDLLPVTKSIPLTLTSLLVV